MLTENKFSKYLLYAIGEIILVVIGILIALQINNNNNFNEQRKVEQEYLLSLQVEFESNLNKINISIQENEERRQALENILTLFDRNVLDTVPHKTIAQIFRPIFGGGLDYQPATGVLNDLISSGNLNIIHNKSLRQHLASFESSLEFLKTQKNAVYLMKDKMLTLFYKKGSLRNVAVDVGINFEQGSISEEVNNKLVFDSIEFENYLLDYYLTTIGTNGPKSLSGIKGQIEQILVDIDSELKK